MTRATDLRSAFRAQHEAPGALVMPNPWDIGSARLLVACGATALATTSAGFAASRGRLDQNIDRGELLEHTAELTASVDVPISVDSEDCFGLDAAGVTETAELFAATDAAGFSIEDYDPRTHGLRPVDVAADRVAAAKAGGADLVLTARAEGLLYGLADLDDTIARLLAYRDAGADVVYAPGLVSLADIERVVTEVGVPINVLALPGTPPIPVLGEAGVARVSLGSMFSNAAYGALVAAATEVFGPGTHDYSATLLSSTLAETAFDH